MWVHEEPGSFWGCLFIMPTCGLGNRVLPFALCAFLMVVSIFSTVDSVS